MVGKRIGVFSLALVAVVGCYDTLYGPKLTNAFGFDVLVTVEDDSGRVVTTNWPACRTVFFGTKQYTLETVVIKKDGITLQSIAAPELSALNRALKESGGRGSWMVDSTGVHHAAVEPSCRSTS